MTACSRPGPLHCAAAAAALLLASSCSGVPWRQDIADRVAAVDRDRLRQHVEALVAIGPRPECDRAATEATLRYLERQLASWGYTTERQHFDAIMTDRKPLPGSGGKRWAITAARGVPHHNLVATLPGRGEPGSVVELGAHYDTVWGSPGADDNASGVAAVLETARLMAGAEPRKTVRFVFYAMEEEGLVGSAAHVDRLRAEQVALEGALVLDMVGYASHEPGTQDAPIRIPLLAWVPDTANFSVVVGSMGSGWIGNLLEGAADTYVPELRYVSANRIGSWFADGWRSDHASYWKGGYDAILLSDTAEGRNANYHRPSDTTDTIDWAFLQHNAKTVLATMLTWSGAGDRRSAPPR